MVKRETPNPFSLAKAPKDYDPFFFSYTLRSIEFALNTLNQPEILKGSSLYLDVNFLPTSGYSLRPGFVWRDGPTLKITLETDIFVPSLFITLSLGTITVVTT